MNEKSVPLPGLGIIVSCATYLSSILMDQAGITFSDSLLKTGIIGGLAFSGVSLISSRGNDIEKFFAQSGNSDIKVLKKVKQTYGSDIYLSIPEGLGLSDFNKLKEPFENFLDAEVNFLYEEKKIKAIIKTGKIKDFYLLTKEFLKTIDNDPLKILVGIGRSGNVYWDIKKYPHMLVGGGTGGGKTTFLISLITILLLTRKTNEVMLNLADFKGADLCIFEKSKMVNKFCKTPNDFKALLDELEEQSRFRYSQFAKLGVRDIYKYNSKAKEKLPQILNIVDEFAILEGKKDIHEAVRDRLALDRAAGMHYIIATQSPRKEVIPGLLKCNIPARLGFKTFNSIDSGIIFDDTGLETLKGNGEAMFKTNIVERLQCLYIDEEDAERMIRHTFIKKHKQIKDTSGVISFGNTERPEDVRTNRKV